MSTPSQHLVPIQEIPQIPKGAAAVLKKVFNINLSEYALLVLCQRNDTIKFGLDPRHVSPRRKAHLATLQQKNYIEFSESTGKWELTSAGRAIVVTAPVVVQSEVTATQGKGEVICITSKQSSSTVNSA